MCLGQSVAGPGVGKWGTDNKKHDMAYDVKLADRVRAYLSGIPELKIEEKAMFSGLVFMVNGKMCINVSHDKLMCRFDPALTDQVAEKTGFKPMIMKGKQLKGYGLVEPEGFTNRKDFAYWVDLCLQFNHQAKASRKGNSAKTRSRGSSRR